MKKLSLTLTAIFILNLGFTQVDRSIRPQPGPAPLIEIGDARQFTLDNGLRVFVVENHKIPRVTFSMYFDYDPVFEGPFAGAMNITGQMLKTATDKRTKEMIDDEIDFIGATMNASSRSVFASGLSRHTATITELIADVLINARFEQEHFDRIMTQTKSGLAAERNDPASIAARINRVLLYGSDHPYGVNTTEESLNNISIDMCREFYNTFFRPEVTYMAIVGDVEFNEIKKLIETHFKAWERGRVPSMDFPIPRPPDGTRVAIFDRPNAVQSTIRVSFPVDLKPGSEDAIAARVMNLILGGSTSRLFDNLRETHGFTYGAYSSLNADKHIGSFTAFTDVRNIATDSAVHEILFEINRLRYEPVPKEELQLYKNELNGNFALSLESPQTVANFAINIARYGLPADYYATYLQRLAEVSVEDIQRVANRYLFPDNANVLIVGKAADITESMLKFAANDRILYFDEDGNEYDPNQRLRPAPAGMTAAQVTANYINARGGEKRLMRMKDLTISATSEMQGMTLNFDTYQIAPNKIRVEVSMGGTVMNTQIFDGKRGVANSPMGKQEIKDEMLEEMKLQSVLNLELFYDKYGIGQELLGIETLAGKDAYKLDFTYPSGINVTEYYDVETGLKLRSLTSSGITEYADYREVDGIKFPFAIKQSMGPQVFDMKVISVKVNSKLKDDLFEVD
jgi:zinc protease